MEANVGDVIKWSYEGTDYYSRIDAILKDGYGVHVVYEEFGLMQDIIIEDGVLAVYSVVNEAKLNDLKEF